MMSAMEVDTLWHSAFGEGSTRPVLYSSEELNDEGWQPLTEPQNFIMNLKTLNHPQLYAVSSNNQIAMRLAQDEYLEIERQIASIKGKDIVKNPRSLPEHDVFEERKESALYGYKYDGNRPALLQAGVPGLRLADDLTEREKHDVRLFQEPFEQGGFVPKEREYKAMTAKAKTPNNIDGWEPINKDGQRLVPKQQTHHDEYNITYVKRIVNSNGEIVRPISPNGVEVPGETPDKAVNKRLTRTRFDGKKFPPTRDASEELSGASTPRGRKRASSSGDDSRDNTPSSKRQKVVTALDCQEQTKPKHPNQYTKAKERATQDQLCGTATPVPQAAAKATSSSRVSWRELSPASKYHTHTWTDADLHEAIREDHLWLHEDPIQAETWKKKLLANDNPIRSFAMYKKWKYWKEKGLAKRPRNKNVGPENGASNKEIDDYNPSRKPRRPASKVKKVGHSGASTPAITPATTPSPTPAPEVREISEESERASSPVVKPRAPRLTRGREQGNESLRQKALQLEKEKRNRSINAKQVNTERKAPSTVSEEVSAKETGEEISGNRQELRRPSLKHQGSESTILVKPSVATMANATGTPPRRSTRNRRGSA